MQVLTFDMTCYLPQQGCESRHIWAGFSPARRRQVQLRRFS